jgi:hypothetical protein
MPQTLTGIYENLTPGGTSAFGNTFQFERLLLRDDSSFTFYNFNEQGCYSTSHGRSGKWSIVNDSIQLNTSDTIPRKLNYLQDNSSKLTLEFFDQFGCQYIQPIPIYFKGRNETQFTKVKYGLYKKKFAKKFDMVKLSKDFQEQESFLIPVKRDSMHIQIYGLTMPHAKVFEQTKLAKEGTVLKGSTYVIGKYNKGYVSNTLYQKRKFNYYPWEL